VARELSWLRDRKGKPLTNMAVRFAAIDASLFDEVPTDRRLESAYSLSDHLFVEPNPLLRVGETTHDFPVQMTSPEIAVAMSHLDVWHLIANGEKEYSLVLEDDVVFCREFAKVLEKAWKELTEMFGRTGAFDVFYLSYEASKFGVEKHDVSSQLFRPLRGLWFLSGYVLSRKGAQALLGLLPVRGPVDLWLNQQFERLDVLAVSNPIIEQRMDGGSDNAYSILPVLSRAGTLADINPAIFRTPKLRCPVFAVGAPGSGITSVASALSMLGYRCCSDIDVLPTVEFEHLSEANSATVFNAYCNIGNFSSETLATFARQYGDACFIVTMCGEASPQEEHVQSYLNELGYGELPSLTENLLVLPSQGVNKWKALTEFLRCSPPICPYPNLPDREPRPTVPNEKQTALKCKSLDADESPWIVRQHGWNGIRVKPKQCGAAVVRLDDQFERLDENTWRILCETFPSNLALFHSANVGLSKDQTVTLTLCKQAAAVRDLTSGAIATKESHLFGHFSAVMRPASGNGLISGMFLHRNSPRQEIDVEVLGRDPTKLLANVYFNPGCDGSRMDYGYRGTPVLIDLGFDASKDFHEYAIEWSSTEIRWLVDGKVVHERVSWDPTPIPHLPMRFFLNLWPSKSHELAGELDTHGLPAITEIRSVKITSTRVNRRALYCDSRSGYNNVHSSATSP
jgi:GR25 family glycosyltransferase involved in LPS biosynthesis